MLYYTNVVVTTVKFGWWEFGKEKLNKLQKIEF